MPSKTILHVCRIFEELAGVSGGTVGVRKHFVRGNGHHLIFHRVGAEQWRHARPDFQDGIHSRKVAFSDFRAEQLMGASFERMIGGLGITD